MSEIASESSSSSTGTSTSAPQESTAVVTSTQQTATQAPARDARAAYNAIVGGKGREEASKAYVSGLDPDPAPGAVVTPENQAGSNAGEDARASGETLGLSDKQVQALKRAKAFNPDALKVMPLSNRKAFADQIGKSLSELDRKHSAIPGKVDPTGEALSPSQEEGAPAGDTTSQPKEGVPPEQQAPAMPDFTPEGIATAIQTSVEQEMAQAVKPEEAQALADLLGDDAFNVYQAREVASRKAVASAVAKSITQTVAPLLNVVMAMAQQWEDDEFSASVESLKKSPGYDKLDLNADNLTALRQAAAADIRSRKQAGYRFRDAVKSVAGRVFQVDPAKAAQAQLARTSDPYLRNSGSKPNPRLEESRPVSSEQRTRAAFEMAKKGIKGSEITAQLDGR